jgi:hypothetical protein
MDLRPLTSFKLRQQQRIFQQPVQITTLMQRRNALALAAPWNRASIV